MRPLLPAAAIVFSLGALGCGLMGGEEASTVTIDVQPTTEDGTETQPLAVPADPAEDTDAAEPAETTGSETTGSEASGTEAPTGTTGAGTTTPVAAPDTNRTTSGTSGNRTTSGTSGNRTTSGTSGNRGSTSSGSSGNRGSTSSGSTSSGKKPTGNR